MSGSSGHRYWRIVQLNAASGAFGDLGQIDFQSAGVTALGSGTPSVSSATIGSAQSVCSDGGEWFVESQPAWFAYDFGAGNAPLIDGVALAIGVTYPQWTWSSFSLQSSDDAATWSAGTLITCDAWPGPAGQTQYFGTARPATNKRVWRIQINNVQNTVGDHVCRLAEIALLNARGTNLIGAGTASAASAQNSDGAQAACDGDPATYWESGGALPQWWQYDFGFRQNAAIASLSLQAGPAGDTSALGEAPAQFDVLTSQDNVAFTLLKSFAAHWTETGQVQTFEIAAPAAAMVMALG